MWGSFLQGCEGTPSPPQKLDSLGDRKQTGKVPWPHERDGAKMRPVHAWKLGSYSCAMCLAVRSCRWLGVKGSCWVGWPPASPGFCGDLLVPRVTQDPRGEPTCGLSRTPLSLGSGAQKELDGNLGILGLGRGGLNRWPRTPTWREESRWELDRSWRSWT